MSRGRGTTANTDLLFNVTIIFKTVIDAQYRYVIEKIVTYQLRLVCIIQSYIVTAEITTRW